MTKFLSLEGLKTLITKLKSYFAAKNEAIKSITGSGNKTLTYTRADGSSGTINYQDTTYGTGNTSTAGLTKLYTSLGGQTDGAPTNSLLNSQVSALNTAIGKKADKAALDAAYGEINIDNIDSLCTADDMLQGKPACYTVLYTLTTSNGTVTVKVGVLWVYSDNLRHVVMQVLNTNFVPDDDGTFSSHTHNHDMHEYSRIYCYDSNAASHAGVAVKTWTQWQEVGGKGIVDLITNVALAKQNKLTAGQGIKIVDNTISVQVDSTLFVVVTSLPDAPASGNEGKIHLVPLSKTSTNNKYAEYIWRGTTDKWEQLGTISSKMDLSDYSTTEQVKALIKTETDARTAAETALGNRISALEGDEDVFQGTAGNVTSITTDFTGYWLATNDEHCVLKCSGGGSPVQVPTIGTFLFYDTPTGDWYIVDTGKSTTKVQTSITDSEITALFS
jgi:hypothetical protein